MADTGTFALTRRRTGPSLARLARPEGVVRRERDRPGGAWAQPPGVRCGLEWGARQERRRRRGDARVRRDTEWLQRATASRPYGGDSIPVARPCWCAPKCRCTNSVLRDGGWHRGRQIVSSGVRSSESTVASRSSRGGASARRSTNYRQSWRTCRGIGARRS
jgi:hypothetical protein